MYTIYTLVLTFFLIIVYHRILNIVPCAIHIVRPCLPISHFPNLVDSHSDFSTLKIPLERLICDHLS